MRRYGHRHGRFRTGHSRNSVTVAAEGVEVVASENNVIIAILALGFVIACGYALGRVHQGKRFDSDRDDAFRHGYNQATRALLDVARRAKQNRVPSTSSSLAGEAGTFDVADQDRRPVGITRRRIMSGRV
jgi:hypothetical protein